MDIDSKKGKKVAIMIGNNANRKKDVLEVCVENAEKVSKNRTDIRFPSTLVMNAKKADMESAICEFVNGISPGDLVVFFFSG